MEPTDTTGPRIDAETGAAGEVDVAGVLQLTNEKDSKTAITLRGNIGSPPPGKSVPRCCGFHTKPE
jgi:hypothetical protein